MFQGEKIEDIPKEVLMDCAHLVKANSIQGQFRINANVCVWNWIYFRKHVSDFGLSQTNNL